MRTRTRRWIAGVTIALLAALVGAHPVTPAAAREVCNVEPAETFDPNRPSGTRLWPDNQPIEFSYENPALRFAAEPPPSEQNQERARTARNAKIYGPLAEARLALIRAFLDKNAERTRRGKPEYPWKVWLPGYVKGVNTWVRGKFFERMFPKLAGLGPGWECDQPVPGAEECGKRNPDFLNRELRLVIELKVSGGPKENQVARDKCITEKTGWTVITITAQPPTRGGRRLLDGHQRGRWFVAPAVATVSNRPPPEAGRFVGRAQVPAGDALGGLLEDTPASEAEAEIATDVQRGLAVAEGDEVEDVEELGGIDFSTLELRYLKDTYAADSGPGAAYAMSAAVDEDRRWSAGGRRSADLSSDAFFVFLALPPGTLTVNLNPDEPNRIVDEQLGRTEVGRVMLEADLQLKKTVANLMDPRTRSGKRFLRAMPLEAGACVSLRNWIVPGPAAVHEDDDELYILESELGVRTDWLDVKSGPKQCRGQDPALNRHIERVFSQEILPLVIRRVNEAPEYADLRRVYKARIAAEWIRDREQLRPTAYSQEVDSGDVTAWPVSGSWKPRDVFDAYLKSYTEGEYRVRVKVAGETARGRVVGVRTYSQGGVDFSRIPRMRQPASAAADLLPPPELLEQSRRQPVTAASVVWLGGAAPGDPQRNRTAARQEQLATVRRGIVVSSLLGALLVIGTATAILYLVRRRPRD